jgi:hypothetical protein
LGSTWSWWATRSLRSGVALPLGIDVRRYLRFQARRAAVPGALARFLPASALRSLRSRWSACGLGPLRILPRLAGQRRREPLGRACLIAMHCRRLGDARRRHKHGSSSDENCTTGQIGHNLRSLALSYDRLTRFAPLAHSLQPPGESVSASGSRTALPLGHGERNSPPGRTSLTVVGELRKISTLRLIPMLVT